MIVLLAALAMAPQTDRVDAMWDSFSETLDRRMDQYYHAGLFEECVSLLQIMRVMEPGDAQISANLAWMYGNLGRLNEELAEYERFQMQNPNNEQGAVALAQAYAARKQYDKIIPLLQPRVATSMFLPTFSLLARAYEEKGRLREALGIWELRLKKFPDDANAKRNISRLKTKLGIG